MPRNPTDPTPATEETVVDDRDPQDMVHMRHPQIDGPAAGPVTYEAFTTVWRHKGWVLADETEVQQEQDAAAMGEEIAFHITDEQIDALDRQDLENLAVKWGLDPTTHYKFEGSTATGEVDVDAMRAEVKNTIATARGTSPG